MGRYIRSDIRLRFPDGKSYSHQWLDDTADAKKHLMMRFAGKRVECLCRLSSVPMVIRHRGSTGYLSNLPNRGHYHSISCRYHTPDQSIDPIRNYSPAVRSTVGDQTHLTVSSKRLSNPPFTHFSPDALLSFLWQLSGLDYWSPKMSGKRSFYTASQAILTGSSGVYINNTSLSASLFLPQKGVDFPSPPPAYIGGQLHRIFKGPHSVGLTFKYLRSPSFWIARNQWTSSLDQFFGSFESPKIPEDRYIYFLSRCWFSEKGYGHLEDIGIIPLTRHWIPAWNDHDTTLSEALITQSRRFRRILCLDAHADSHIPLVELLDTEKPTYIYNPLDLNFPTAQSPAINKRSATGGA